MPYANGQPTASELAAQRKQADPNSAMYGAGVNSLVATPPAQNGNISVGGQGTGLNAPVAPIAPVQTIPNTIPNATIQPVPGSAGSIFGDMTEAEKFQNNYYKNLNDQYNTPIDEEAIRKQKQADYQAQLDSVKAIYADQLNQARVRGQGRQGSSSAIQARRGLLGSNVGEAMTNNIETLNVQEQDLVRQEEANAIAAIQGLIRSGANEEIAAKKQAIKEGGEKLLAYYGGAGDRKAKKTTDAAKKLLALGKDPSAISDADLATAGIDKNDLQIAFKEQQRAFAKASQEDADKREKAALEALKTQSEIDKNQAAIITEALKTGRVYESGGFIFDGATNEVIGNAQAVARARSGGGGGGGTGGGASGIDTGVGAVSSQPGFRRLKAAEQKQALSLDNLSRELNKYKQIIAESNIGESGVELFGKNSGLIESQLNALLFAAAQAEGTGALQAADRQVLEKVIPNPTTITGAFTSLKSGGLDGVYAKIDNQIRKYNANLANLGITPTSNYQATTTPSSTETTAPTQPGTLSSGNKYTVVPPQ